MRIQLRGIPLNKRKIKTAAVVMVTTFVAGVSLLVPGLSAIAGAVEYQPPAETGGDYRSSVPATSDSLRANQFAGRVLVTE